MSLQNDILLALSATEGSYTYQVVARTKLNSKQVSRALSKMTQAGDIYRQVATNGAYLYFLHITSTYPQLAKPPSILENVDKEAMWHRVAMLRRMRDRTIEEYHPLLNAVIRDYEIFLRRNDEDV